MEKQANNFVFNEKAWAPNQTVRMKWWNETLTITCTERRTSKSQQSVCVRCVRYMKVTKKSRWCHYWTMNCRNMSLCGITQDIGITETDTHQSRCMSFPIFPIRNCDLLLSLNLDELFVCHHRIFCFCFRFISPVIALGDMLTRIGCVCNA